MTETVYPFFNDEAQITETLIIKQRKLDWHCKLIYISSLKEIWEYIYVYFGN